MIEDTAEWLPGENSGPLGGTIGGTQGPYPRTLFLADIRTHTVGCNFVSEFATTGWQNSSRDYSRQYQLPDSSGRQY